MNSGFAAWCQRQQRLDHEVTETVNNAVVPGGHLPTLAFVGAGRAGRALATAAHEAGYDVVAVASRTPANAAELAEAVGARHVATAVRAARAAEVTFLTVPDAAVTRVGATIAASGMALGGRALVHCSGAHSASALAAARQMAAQVGAVHPLQALTADSSPRVLRGTFFSVEADEGLCPTLERMVVDLGGIPFAAPTGDRALYHAAAVLAGNAPLALLARAAGLLETAGVDKAIATEALATLLEGAAGNVRRLGAQAALTGPVVRDDAETVARHLRALRNDEASRRLYLLLARDTLALAGTTGREGVASLLGPAASAPSRSPERRSARRQSGVRPGSAAAALDHLSATA
jgi:predicted short-subunit dehydrogenase-like oxidoreductase (DUF2520 family)